MKDRIMDAIDYIGGKKNYLIIAGVIVGVFFISSIVVAANKKNAPPTTDPVVTEESINSEPSESSIEETSTDEQNESAQIELVAGELGDYGLIIILNEGSDFEDINYCYFVPAGTYQVTNVGEYMTQVDVNKNEKSTDVDSDGNEYEYWTEGTPYVLDVDATEEITVEDGYFIEIEEPTHLILVPIGDTIPQTTDSLDTLSIDEYVAVLEVVLADGFGEDYSVSIDDDNTVVISVWAEGLAQEAVIASQGDETYLTEWGELKDSMQELSQTVYDNACATVDEDEIHVVLHVLNDENMDNTLLSYMDGVLIYDAIE